MDNTILLKEVKNTFDFFFVSINEIQWCNYIVNFCALSVQRVFEKKGVALR